MKKRLEHFIHYLANAGSLPTDTTEQRLRKAVLVFLATLYCFLGMLWGGAYLILEQPLAACFPAIYGVLSAGTLLIFFHTKGYRFFRFSQLILILLLPFSLQWNLGGFGASSAVIIWSILAPIGALMFAGTRQAFPWFFAYLILIGLSGLLDVESAEYAAALSPRSRIIFFVMNIGGVSAIAFVLIRYFVRQRELAMDALGKAHRKVSRERERLAKIKSVLARFVPVTAKNMIEKDPGAILEKYIEDATVLFLDIEGFTTLVHQYSHDRINQVIESYFSTFFDVIQKYGGDVNETAGDGMMVIFLNPNAYKHPANAIRAALAIGKTCDDYRSLGDSDLFPIRVNIGISSGEVFLGSTKMRGSEGDRWTFTASGPVTILAARLSQYGRNGQILVGEETARRVRDSFDLIPLGEVELKNIADPGQVFQVVAASL